MRVVWAMNVAAPYRQPVWEALSNRIDLNVWLLAANEQHRRWSIPETTPYDVTLLRAIGLRRGESVHYVLTGRLRIDGPRPDLIVLPGWDLPAAWQLLLWAKWRGVRTLAFAESTLESHRYSHGFIDHARSWFFRHADGVLTVSPGSTEAIVAAGVPRSRVSQLVNAVDVHSIRQRAFKERVPAMNGPHTYLFAGQLIERKCPELIVQALAGLGDSRLVIAGEGPLAARLRDLVNQLGLAQRTEFLGYVQPADLPKVLGRCHTLVLPSREEVYGLVVTEALAAGLHVVVSERAGVADVVRGMQGTWVVAPQLETLEAGMRASAEAWDGPISTPAVLGHTPDAMAGSIEEAARVTLAACHKLR